MEKTDQVSTIPPHPKGACADESNTYHRPWYGTDGNEWLKFVKCYIFTGKLKLALSHNVQHVREWLSVAPCNAGFRRPHTWSFFNLWQPKSLIIGLFLCYLFFYLYYCLEACSCRDFRWNTELPKCGILVTQSLIFCVVFLTVCTFVLYLLTNVLSFF